MSERIELEQMLLKKIESLYKDEREVVIRLLLQKMFTEDLLKLSQFIEKSVPSL